MILFSPSLSVSSFAGCTLGTMASPAYYKANHWPLARNIPNFVKKKTVPKLTQSMQKIVYDEIYYLIHTVHGRTEQQSYDILLCSMLFWRLTKNEFTIAQFCLFHFIQVGKTVGHKTQKNQTNFVSDPRT